MIKHSVLIALFAKAQDVDPVTANVTSVTAPVTNVSNATNATGNASVNATVVELSPGEKISAFEESMMDVFI